MTKTYDVTITAKGERGTWIAPSVIQVYADTTTQAISRARQHMRFVVGHDRRDGALEYRAKRVKD